MTQLELSITHDLTRYVAPYLANPAALILPLLTLSFVILSLQALYSLCFHPLRSIPGPKLAAVTNWWAYYYELQGVLPFKCKELSEVHNSKILRIGPNRVVIHDATQYEKIYCVGTKFLKDPSFYLNFPSGHDGSTTTSAVEKKVHADRRKLSSAKMSKGNVGDLHDLVASKISMLMERLSDMTRERKPVNVFASWRSMTLDIISTFTFGHSLNALDRNELDHEMLEVLESAVGAFYKFLRIPLVFRICRIPFVNSFIPGIQEMSAFKEWASECVDSYRPKENTKYLFDALMNSPEAHTRLSKNAIQYEAEELLIAGSDTTATTLTYACMNLSQQPDLWEKIYQEVLPLYKDRNTIVRSKDIENLPFLTACIKESLRLASPVPGYLWRIVPETGFTVAGHFLPPKTSIGMSSWIMHYDPSIFPEPQEFEPERWIGDKGVGLDRFLVPFSKGTRQCGGINLAWMEMYVGLATLVRRFELDVVENGKMKSAKKMEQKEYFVGLLTDPNLEVSYIERPQ